MIGRNTKLSQRQSDSTFLFSFWKVDPLPKKNEIAPVNWHHLGDYDEVVNKLLDIKNTSLIVEPLNSVITQPHYSVKVKWNCDRGVYLTVTSEDKKPKRGNVLMIGGISFINNDSFYKLFTQVYEQFDIVLFDEQMQEFVNIIDFKRRLR